MPVIAVIIPVVSYERANRVEQLTSSIVNERLPIKIINYFYIISMLYCIDCR